MKYVIWILRIVLGCVFIFSGVVKANDPLGLTYKMEEIFEVWGMTFLSQYAFWFSVLMIAFEIIAGFAVIVGNTFRLWISMMLALNVFYTFLTGYILYSGKIRECGCFGDCFKISNVATFNKDVALTAINVVLFIFRFRVFPIFQKSAINFSLVTLSVLFSVGFQWWTLNHLPYHDCLAYRVGNNLLEKMKPAPGATPAVYETILTYEKNGVKKDFPSDKIPWQDKSWKYVDSKTKLIKEATGEPEIHDFSLGNESGDDVTEAVMSAKGFTFLWFLRDPEKASTLNMDRLRAIIKKCKENNVPFYVLASVDRKLCNTYMEVWEMKGVKVLTLDGTVNKTAMRTNPGLMLLQDGVVAKKWAPLDYPKSIDILNGTVLTDTNKPDAVDTSSGKK